MRKSNVVRLNKEWWKKEREPGDSLIIQRKRKLAERYFSLHELSKRFQCGYDLLYKAVRRGELEAEVVGKSYRVSEEALERFLDLCRKKKRA